MNATSSFAMYYAESDASKYELMAADINEAKLSGKPGLPIVIRQDDGSLALAESGVFVRGMQRAPTSCDKNVKGASPRLSFTNGRTPSGFDYKYDAESKFFMHDPDDCYRSKYSVGIKPDHDPIATVFDHSPKPVKQSALERAESEIVGLKVTINSLDDQIDRLVHTLEFAMSLLTAAEYIDKSNYAPERSSLLPSLRDLALRVIASNVAR